MIKGENKTVSFLGVHIFNNYQVVEYLEDAKVKFKLLFHIKKQLDKYLFFYIELVMYIKIKKPLELLFSSGHILLNIGGN